MDNTTTPFSESFVYRKVVPWFLISLCLLYVHILLFRFFMWQFQRYKRKRDRAQRQRLEVFWRQRMAQLNAPQTSVQPPEQTHQPLSFDSSITLVETPLKHYNTKQDDEKVMIGEPRYRLQFLKSESKDQQKRRQLLWQWSVAMGYCRYHHGHYMNQVIHRLIETKKVKI